MGQSVTQQILLPILGAKSQVWNFSMDNRRDTDSKPYQTFLANQNALVSIGKVRASREETVNPKCHHQLYASDPLLNLKNLNLIKYLTLKLFFKLNKLT